MKKFFGRVMENNFFVGFVIALAWAFLTLEFKPPNFDVVHFLFAPLATIPQGGKALEIIGL